MTDRLEELDSEYVQCRALLHSWEEIPNDGEGPAAWKPSRSVTILLFRCAGSESRPGCGTKRYDIWSNVTGDLVDRAYRHPDGYALPKGRGRKVLVRREYLRRRNPNQRNVRLRKAG